MKRNSAILTPAILASKFPNATLWRGQEKSYDSDVAQFVDQGNGVTGRAGELHELRTDEDPEYLQRLWAPMGSGLILCGTPSA